MEWSPIAVTYSDEPDERGSLENSQVFAKYTEPPTGKGKYVVLGPLEKLKADPNVVMVFCIPEQADRLTALTALWGCEVPMTFFPAMTACMPIANPLVTGKTDISFISRHAREVRKLKTSDNELLISILYPDFEAAIKAIPFSGYGTVKMEFPVI